MSFIKDIVNTEVYSNIAQQYRDIINNQDAATISIIRVITITILFLAALFLFKKVFFRVRNKSVLLLGASEAGKTALFCQLCYNVCPQTFTSMCPTQAAYTPDPKFPKKIIQLIDIPGNGRLRQKYINKYKKHRIVAILFVIDSIEFEMNVTEVADCLFEILNDKIFNKTNLIIVCNKQDLDAAVRSETIQNKLEHEIQLKKETFAYNLDALGAKNKKSGNLSNQKSKEFSFSNLSNKTTFLYSSATNMSKPGIEELQKSLIDL